MKHLFRAKDEDGNLVYGSVVYGQSIPEYWDVEVTEIDWDTLEFNLNGQWIKYEVKECK